MLTYGFDGPKMTTSAASMAARTPGAGGGSPSKRTARTACLARSRTNQSWKERVPASRVSIIVRQGPSAIGRMRGPTPSARERRRVTSLERLAAGEGLRAQEVRGEVAVAELEPGLAPVAPHHLERVERLLREAPAALLVREVGQRVHHRVHVRRDVEPPVLEVVPRVHDHGERSRREGAGEAVDEAGAADAAGEGDHLVHA